jgi:hypothetical protein
MGRAVKHAHMKRLLCTTCRKEMPGTPEKDVKTKDQLVHFCGVECFSDWWKRAHPVPPVHRERRV